MRYRIHSFHASILPDDRVCLEEEEQRTRSRGCCRNNLLLAVVVGDTVGDVVGDSKVEAVVGHDRVSLYDRNRNGGDYWAEQVGRLMVRRFRYVSSVET